MSEMKVKVGVAILLMDQVNKGSVLMARRQGAHGTGQWSFPGGKIDPGETSVEAAQRELLEETGIWAPIQSFQLVLSNLHYFPEIDTEYVTIFFRVEDWVGIPKVMEPNKVAGGWEWIKEGKWPHPLFEPVTKLVEEGKLMR